MTRRELLGRIDSAEQTDWVAYDRVHVSRTDALLAQLCSLVYAAIRDPKTTRPMSPDDFLGLKKRRIGVSEVMGRIKRWALATQAMGER